jgi:predicted O-methyltransferase YrrM
MREKVKNTLLVTESLIEYCEDHFVTLTPAMKKLREQTATMPEGHMQITALQGQLLGFLVKLINAKNILEIGTYTGYSALIMAHAMGEDGHITTCDRNAEWTKIAKKFWALANMDHKITLLLGDGFDTLKKLREQNLPPFDMVFIDGSKRSYQAYFEQTFSMLKPGGLIVVDNTLWYGHVANAHTDIENAKLMRDFNTFIKNHPSIEKTLCGSPTDMFVVLMKKN